MTYEEKYQELVELSRSDNPSIRENANAWLVSIGLQDPVRLRVSAFQLAIRNVKGEITREEVSLMLWGHYGDTLYEESKTGIDGGYEILPLDSPKIKKIEVYNRKLRPALYTELDKKRNRRFLR